MLSDSEERYTAGSFMKPALPTDTVKAYHSLTCSSFSLTISLLWTATHWCKFIYLQVLVILIFGQAEGSYCEARDEQACHRLG